LSSKQIFLQIYKDLELGKIELPTLPDLAIKIRQTLKDETTPIRDVTKIISTAAMMQDIGALPIIQKLSRIPDIFNQPIEVNRIIEAYTAKVGALLLHKWNFENEMVEAVRSRKHLKTLFNCAARLYLVLAGMKMQVKLS